MGQSSSKSIDFKELISNDKVLESHVLSILDSIPDALLVTESDNHISFFNNTFVQLWQVPAEIIKTYSRELIFSYLDSRIKTNAYFIEKVAYLNLNPMDASFELLELFNEIYIECYTWPRWVDNKIAGRIWSFRDVTQQKRIEEILKKQKQELVNAHRIASIGSWTYNIRTKEFTLSESMSQMCEGVLVRKSLEDFINVAHVDERNMVRSFFTHIVALGKEPNYELKYRVAAKNDRVYYVRTVVEVVYQLGKPKLLLGTIQDTTKQAMLEISLASAKEAAEDYNLAKGIFLANMSHEMRTPLNAILGYAEILSQMPGTKAQLDYIDSIKSSGESLLALIEDVLYISRIDGQEINVNEEEVNIDNLIQEIYKLFKFQFDEKGLEFKIDKSINIPSGIYIDRARLKQIFINIIGNAIKFTEKGYVYLMIDIRKIPDVDMVDMNLYVEDTGIGIEEKDKHKIFEAFRQAEDEDKRNFEGIGLGLYITKKNVDLLGGAIEIQSVPNIGTVFMISFKNLKIPKNSFIDANYAFYETNNEKANLLILTDSNLNKRIFYHLLSTFNLNILEVNNSVDAILMAEKEKPAIIIVDMVMPTLDGFDTIKQIRTNNELKDTPVIAYLSYNTTISAAEIKDAGFNESVIKPVSCYRLVEVLGKFLKQKVANTFVSTKKDDNLDEFELMSKIKDGKLSSTQVNVLTENWKQLMKKKTLKNQKEFADILLKLGDENELETISNIASSLINAIDIYDVEETSKIMNKIDQCMKKLIKET